MARFYLDSDVWIAFLDDNDKRHRIASRLFEFIIKAKHEIVCSVVHKEEMQHTGNYKRFAETNTKLRAAGTCIGFQITRGDIALAKNLDQKLRLGFKDCLHLTIAERLNAITVSFDKHWQEIGRVLGKKVFTPSEALLWLST